MNYPRITACLALTLFLAMSPSTSHAGRFLFWYSSKRLPVTVYNFETGEPLPDAEVTLRWGKLGRKNKKGPSRTIRTDQDGSFVIPQKTFFYFRRPNLWRGGGHGLELTLKHADCETLVIKNAVFWDVKLGGFTHRFIRAKAGDVRIIMRAKGGKPLPKWLR